MSIQQKTNELFEDQLRHWPLLGSNWKQMDAALIKRFDFEGFSI